MAPANAIGTPIRAGKLYPNPIATGIPPRKAPMALPGLKAALNAAAAQHFATLGMLHDEELLRRSDAKKDRRSR